ncbi:MAG TPA: hypothetical protein PLR39_02465 [Treponemataceae bacterium]|jgi:NAD-dependent SIR2 family protein deacetylase|nr:hypothetical protein [Treponemataceae bacterium]HOS29641.1 hypothetical protein [Treponemataceae bacterium]
MKQGLIAPRQGSLIMVTCTHCRHSFSTKKPATNLLYALVQCPKCKKLGVEEDRRIKY